MRRITKPREFDPEKLKKGQLLVVRVPPFYDKEYLYEVSGAGGKVLRANLYHSPRVKKQWTYQDLEILFDNGMIRFAANNDLERLKPKMQGASESTETDESLSEADSGASAE